MAHALTAMGIVLLFLAAAGGILYWRDPVGAQTVGQWAGFCAFMGVVTFIGGQQAAKPGA